jgi:hypothetical protein
MDRIGIIGMLAFLFVAVVSEVESAVRLGDVQLVEDHCAAWVLQTVQPHFGQLND